MPLYSLREIVECSTHKKECRNAVCITFVCTRQTRVNCQSANGKGVLKFRKLKKFYLDFSEIFLENLSIINPAGFAT